MYKIFCEICQVDFEPERNYNDDQCPRCKQNYIYDNDCHRIDLTETQLEMLREPMRAKQEPKIDEPNVDMKIPDFAIKEFTEEILLLKTIG